MYCGGERRWRKEIYKEKCMVGVEEEGEEEEEEEDHPPLINRGSDGRVGIQ